MVLRLPRTMRCFAFLWVAVPVSIYLLYLSGGPQPLVQPPTPTSGGTPLVQSTTPLKSGGTPLVQSTTPLKSGGTPLVQSTTPLKSGGTPLVQMKEKKEEKEKEEKKVGWRSFPESRGFLVDTAACKIPDLDPMDPSIADMIEFRGSVSCTGGQASVTHVEGVTLRINRTYIRKELNGDFSHCRYKVITRRSRDDANFNYSGLGEKFDSDIKPKDEFIRTYCYNRRGGVVTSAFHALVLPRAHLERDCHARLQQHVQRVRPKEILNVLIVGVDSMSRLNVIRQMPETRDFLLKELGALEMTGYTKVADNTFPNVVPLLTGRFVEELPWDESMQRQPFDRYDIIWKNFSRAGYRTLYSEDLPFGATFNYLREGFRIAPADYYPRGLALAMEADKTVWSQKHRCVGNVMEADKYLRYASDFSSQFNASSQPHFGYTFQTRLTHNVANDAGAADVPHLNFLKRLKSQRMLERTVLVLFSDHGIRFGDMRKTYVGKAEERLPALFLVLPKWFQSRYPQLYRNLQVNTKRLTTPFDVHETLNDILYFDGRDRPNASLSDRGISLFREIPETRTCSHAQILPHWCMCTNGKRMSPDSGIVVKTAQELVKNVNHFLRKDQQRCEGLSLKEVVHAEQVNSNEFALRFAGSNTSQFRNMADEIDDLPQSGGVYQVTLHTTPGDALFEGTMTYDGGNNSSSFVLAGDISRINLYGTQSECIDDPYLKKFCFCKDRSKKKTLN